MSKMNLEAFDTYVSSYGYDYHSKNSDENASYYSYVEYDGLISKKQKRVISISYYTSNPINSISYSTSIKEEYSKLKNETLGLGFNIYKTDEIESKDNIEPSSIVFRYRKDNQTISITNSLNSYNIVYSTFE